tara:strand:- start:477 stop:689 length:213 start_codon:yes stop_codon:yes gene_type:complete
MKKILLLILVTFVFNSCVDANPNIEAHNDIHITIDGENLDGFIGEWKITSEEKEEDGKEVVIIRIEKSEL